MSLQRRGVTTLLVLACMLPGALTAGAEDEEVPSFEEEVQTLAPLSLESGAKRQRIDIELHLWGGAGTGEDGHPMPRVLDVEVTGQPPFIQNLALVPGKVVTFEPRESVRPIRLEFDVGKRNEGDATPPLVIQITSRDPAVIPQRRRLELPLELPPTDGYGPDGVEIYARYEKKVEGGRGIMAEMVSVRHEWERPSAENAHPYTGNEAYLHLSWPEATPDRYVIARGRISGGVPGIRDEEAEFEHRPSGGHPFRATFRNKTAFNIRFPIEKPNTGTIHIKGKLLAFDHQAARNHRDENRFDESRALAAMPFQASVTIPQPPLTSKPGTVKYHRGTARASGSVPLQGLQPGRRVARLNAGGIPYFGYIVGASGGTSNFTFHLVGYKAPPTSGRVSFENFGQQVSVSVELVPEIRGEKPNPDSSQLAKLQADLQRKRRDPRDQLSWNRGRRESIKKWHWQNRGYAPGAWITACEAWFAALERESAALSNPGWEGYNGRPPKAEKLAEDSGYWWSRTANAYLRSAKYVMDLGQIPRAEAWIKRAESITASKLASGDERRVQSMLSSLATAYSSLSSATFRLTGNIDRANQLDWKSRVAAARSRGEQPKRRDPLLYRIDPEFGGIRPDEPSVDAADPPRSTPRHEPSRPAPATEPDSPVPTTEPDRPAPATEPDRPTETPERHAPPETRTPRVHIPPELDRTPPREPPDFKRVANASKSYTEMLESAREGDADAMNKLGYYHAYAKGAGRDLERAMKWYALAAEGGDNSARENLGRRYAQGDGVKRDLKRALEHYRDAAASGSATGANGMGWILERGGDGVAQNLAEAVRWYRRGVERGDSFAMSNLGRLYGEGRGVAKDERKAFDLYKRSAELDNDMGANQLARAYLQGQGVEANPREAFRWFERAAKAGHVDATYEVAIAHYWGRGTPVDTGAGLVWIKKAAELGQRDALNDLGQLHIEGRGVPQNVRRGNELFAQAAKKGLHNAEYNLALSYRLGRGVAVDPKRALRLLRKAASQNHELAQIELAKMLIEGAGTKRDPRKALQLLDGPAKRGNAYALRILADFYYHGQGARKDVAKAIEYFAAAGRAGDADAASQVGFILASGEAGAPDYKGAVDWFVFAAERGSAIAQRNLGVVYRDAVGVARDLVESYGWFYVAAEHGDREYSIAALRALEPHLTHRQRRQLQPRIDEIKAHLQRIAEGR